MTLTEFLLARYAEDEGEATARREHNEGCFPNMDNCQSHYGEDGQWSWGPARVLAECEAKRRIVELADEAEGLDGLIWSERDLSTDPGYDEPRCGERILRALAAVYADHPDYQQEWKP